MLLDSADACGEDKLKLRFEVGSDPSVPVATAALFTTLAEAKGGGVAVLPIDRDPGVVGGDGSAEEASGGKDVGIGDNVVKTEELTGENPKAGSEPLADWLGAGGRADQIDGGCIGCEYCSASAEKSGLASGSGVVEGSAGIMLNAGDAEAAAAPSTCAAVSVNISRLPFAGDDGVAE